MAVTGDKITAQYFNDLFAQLKKIRDEHAARADLTSAQKTNLNAINPTNITVGETAKTSNTVSVVKNGLSTLASNGTGISSSFSSSITIPSVGSLIYPISTAVDGLNAADGVCPNCSHFTSAASQGNFSSNFGSHFTSAASRGNFSSNFTSAASRGNFSSNFGSHFTTAASRGYFGSNFTSGFEQGHYTANFASAASCGFFTSAASRGNFTSNFTTAASKGNFTSAASRGNFSSNFTTTASRGNFTTVGLRM